MRCSLSGVPMERQGVVEVTSNNTLTPPNVASWNVVAIWGKLQQRKNES